MICAIVAADIHNGIGSNNKLLAHIPEDMEMFKNITKDKTVVMGRKTYESIPNKPLKNRLNIVITSNDKATSENDNVIYVNMDTVKKYLYDKTLDKNNGDVFIIGGGQIYKELLPYCERVYITRIFHAYDNVDTYFPDIDKDKALWNLTSASELKNYNGVKYRFFTYDRNNKIITNKQVFIINGNGGVGKDKFISIVSTFTPTMNYSSVSKVKEIAKIIGWTGAKTEKDRKFLSDLKLLCIDYNDMPLNDMKNKVEEFYNSDKTFLFLHIREPIEIDKAKKAFNAKTILIKRDSVEHITSNMSDANVYNYDYDIIIDNDGTLNDLKEKAIRFVNNLLN